MANALAELDAAGVALYSDQQAIDSTTPMGRAMIQMASVFGEHERQIIRERVLAGLDRVRQQGKKLGRAKVAPNVEKAIHEHLCAENGILKVAALVGVGRGTVRRVKREMAGGVGGRGATHRTPPLRPLLHHRLPTLIAPHAATTVRRIIAAGDPATVRGMVAENA